MANILKRYLTNVALFGVKFSFYATYFTELFLTFIHSFYNWQYEKDYCNEQS